MSACQKAAQQATDILAQQAKMDEDCGCDGGCSGKASPKKAALKKQGCKKQGPGCKNAACNKAADMAVDIINATADFSDGIPEFTMADYHRVKMLGGVDPAALGFRNMGGSLAGVLNGGGAGWRVGGTSSRARQSGRGPASAEEVYEQAKEAIYPGHNCSYYSDCERCAESPTKCQQQCPEVYDACYAADPATVLTPPTYTGPCSVPDANCDPPPIVERSIAGIARSTHVNVLSCDDDWTELIEKAWTLLEDNVDLLDWVACTLFGSYYTTAISGLVLKNSPWRINVTCVECDHWPVKGDILWTGLGGVHVCLDSKVSEHWIAAWTSACSDAERTCILIDVAASLAHELTHASTLVPTDAGGGTCHKSYMFENTLRWALIQYYPTAKDASCCQTDEWMPYEDLYLSDASVDIDGSCGGCENVFVSPGGNPGGVPGCGNGPGNGGGLKIPDPRSTPGAGPVFDPTTIIDGVTIG